MEAQQEQGPWTKYCANSGCLEDRVNPDGSMSLRNSGDGEDGPVLKVPAGELAEYIEGKARAMGLLGATAVGSEQG